MLAGIKVIPREKLLEQGEERNSSDETRRKTARKKKQDKHPEHGERKSGKKRRKWKKKDLHNSDSDSDLHGRERECSYEKDNFKSQKKRVMESSDDSQAFVESAKMKVDGVDSMPEHENVIMRKEVGLEWMLKPIDNTSSNLAPVKSELDEPQIEEIRKLNQRELNPFLRDNGSGYPEEGSYSGAGSNQLLSSSLVGDGGASWRLKALKRAKEQSAREGRSLKDVVGERWGSLQEFATSVSAYQPASIHAHLHATKERRKRRSEMTDNIDEKVNDHDYLRDVSSRHPEMKKPKRDDLHWKRKQFHRVSSADSSLMSEAMSGINKFANDGSFMNSIISQQKRKTGIQECSVSTIKDDKSTDDKDKGSGTKYVGEAHIDNNQDLSSNQLAAKVLQLRMKGKYEEADHLSKQMMSMAENQNRRANLSSLEGQASTSRRVDKQHASERKKQEEDADKHLAQKIIQNRQYSISRSAEDEYDFDNGVPSRKHNKRGGALHDGNMNMPRRILTQKERCQFCFDNSTRPKDLVISIANFTYLILPPWEPVVQGHCCVLPMQHDSATRTVDRNVWEEIRNFKKCLLKMFLAKDKDVLFLETVIGLSRQCRHCLIECIPIPSDIAKQAPLYFKKAIDEAEDEWGQHEMKKVISTSGNLRNVIPENFSYFHVEFGLDRGFVHVIDNDSNFPSSFGLNVIRGMLHLAEEDMHRRHRRREAHELQKQAVAAFAREWDPFDWTKELD